MSSDTRLFLPRYTANTHALRQTNFLQVHRYAFPTQKDRAVVSTQRGQNRKLQARCNAYAAVRLLAADDAAWERLLKPRAQGAYDFSTLNE